MKRTGRLIEDDGATVRHKIQTNIRYLQDADFLADGFLDFIRRYNSADFQYARFESHVRHIVESKNFVPIDGVGYGSPLEYFRLQWRDPQNRKMMFRRALFLLHNPKNFLTVLKARRLTKKVAKEGYKLDINFNYWAYVWTNIGLKYWGVTRKDFALKSVPADFDFAQLLNVEALPAAQGGPHAETGNEKTAQQARYTNKALEDLVKSRTAAAGQG